MKPVSLDGSTLEGGGQLVRVALSLSAITGVPVHIYNIRANRAPQGRRKTTSSSRGGRGGGNASTNTDGGLKESHLAALQFLAYHCDAAVEGAEINSTEITFVPGGGYESLRGKGRGRKQAAEAALVDFDNNIIELQRPGSVWLILQAVLPFLLFRRPRNSLNSEKSEAADEIELTLRGGTNVSKSMSGDYVQHVLLPILERIGVPHVKVDVLNRGWAGNTAEVGEVKIRLPCFPDQALTLPGFVISDRGDLDKIEIKIVAGSEYSRRLAEEELKALIANELGSETTVEVLNPEDSGNERRFYILVIAHTTNGWRLGVDYLGGGRMPKNQAEQRKIVQTAVQTVVASLCRKLARTGCVDQHLQDQLVVFQALASGQSTVDGGPWMNRVPITSGNGADNVGSLHTRTVRWVCEQILLKNHPEFGFEQGGRCRGIGNTTDASTQKSTNLEEIVDIFRISE